MAVDPDPVDSVAAGSSGSGWSGSDSAVDVPVSFELDIQPILAAHGCNAGACHGKQRGQNGFQLSLLGFDSDFDYNALVHQSRGRRLSVLAPESSLLIQKATAELPHGGGRKIEPHSKSFAKLASWIRQGAPRRLNDHHSVALACISCLLAVLHWFHLSQLSRGLWPLCGVECHLYLFVAGTSLRSRRRR